MTTIKGPFHPPEPRLAVLDPASRRIETAETMVILPGVGEPVEYRDSRGRLRGGTVVRGRVYSCEGMEWCSYEEVQDG